MASPDPYEGIRTGNNPGSFDIVKEYDWTSVPRNTRLRDEAPSAYITAYELKFSQLKTFIDGYMNIFSPQNNEGSYGDSDNPGLDFYKGLYNVADTPLARFNFPFFSSEMRAFSTEFENTFSPISQRGAQMLGAPEIEGFAGGMESLAGGAVALGKGLGDVGGQGLQTLVKDTAKTAFAGVNSMLGTKFQTPGKQTVGAPGTYIETPKFYQYSDTDNGVQIGFTLSNTLADPSEGFRKNYDFITKFTKINRPFRRGPIGMNFPAIYNLVIPGVRYIQWASLDSFNVGMLGNRRKIPVAGLGDIVVPEAYTCNFSFKSLTIEPANFIDEITEFKGGLEGYATGRNKEEGEVIAQKEKEKAAARARDKAREAAKRESQKIADEFREAVTGVKRYDLVERLKNLPPTTDVGVDDKQKAEIQRYLDSVKKGGNK